MDDREMQDADAVEEEQMQYGHGVMTEDELNEKYPNRPHNLHKTLPFHDLFLTLFNPLNENRKGPTGPTISRKKTGPNTNMHLSPHEIRRNIIERFISRWRKEVGNDIYPAFRLIIPEKDRDRAMYGLKEKTIGKLLVRVIGIDKSSEDAYNLSNWKLPGLKTSASAGDFAGRCYEVLSKRPIRTEVGDVTIAEANEMLDKLSMASKEEDQLPIFEQFYRRMNAEEMMWLIRIILRQMKVGATEKTFLDIWHPDAESLFNVSSSLRRVCWELYDPSIRLEQETYSITLMQCFQPQLAAFQMNSFEKVVSKMKPTEDDDAFWIEEKLDGERMQMHMVEDESVPGGRRFAFWSRKAKDYTYLYGSSLEDDNSALTRHLKDTFHPSVRNIILDGEMITWDMELDAMVPFGTLKTAALAEQKNPFAGGQRPLYRVFDCLYLNDMPITKYTLRDRRRALEASLKPVERRLEIHPFLEAHTVAEIEPALRQVVAEASEGLVIKNPRSMYKLNERNDDWIKVKPEYMTEFGESLDCIVVGGYYGSGHRGGRLSSFMCGLRVDENQIQQGANPQKCYSFFKVGGGMSASDYAAIRHATDGKWHDWDPKKPPTEYIELAGGDRQFERPDVWIKPADSIVISVKAASVASTDQFRMGQTLRFPRFKKLRPDKDWKSALSIQEFIDLKANVERERSDKQFEIDDERRKRRAAPRKRKRLLTVLGGDRDAKATFDGPHTKVFEGLLFFIITDSINPERKSKAELEQMVKVNGGAILQSQNATSNVICVADREPIKVRSIKKEGKLSIVRPSWLFDCIKQSQIDGDRPRFVVPMEPTHMYFAKPDDLDIVESNVDEFGDSYCRDVTPAELENIFNNMASRHARTTETSSIISKLEESGNGLEELRGWMFMNCVVYFDPSGSSERYPDLDPAEKLRIRTAERTVSFASGRVSSNIDDLSITQIVVAAAHAKSKEILDRISGRKQLPRIVSLAWVEESWREGTLLDEERFAVR